MTSGNPSIVSKVAVGQKIRIYNRFGPAKDGYLVHVVAIVDDVMVVWKYFGKHKQWWHYGVEHIDIFKIWIDRGKP